MWLYIKRLLKTAFKPVIGVGDILSGLVGTVLGIVDHYWPHLNLVTSYGWQIPLWGFTFVVLVRLVLSPFWLAQEDAEEIAHLRASTDQVRRRLYVKAKLGMALEEGKQLKRNCRAGGTAEEHVPVINDYLRRTHRFIETALGDGEAALFNSSAGIILYGDGEPNSRLQNEIEWRLQRLVQIIQRVDTSPIRPDFVTPPDEAVPEAV